MRVISIILITLLLCLSSCKEEFEGYSGAGKVPDYIPLSELDDISSQPAQVVGQSGPIFLLGDFFFMIEFGKGIHVYDIADNQEENSLIFIKIPAVTDFTIDGNILYADSWKDLVSIDISDIYNVFVLSRTENVFNPFLFPALFNGPFECVDDTKGAVIGWSDEVVENVFCHTIN